LSVGSTRDAYVAEPCIRTAAGVSFRKTGRGVDQSAIRSSAGDRSFGLCRDLQSINVAMQLKNTGLRTVCRWKTSAPAP
jgi:hypothetical protein